MSYGCRWIGVGLIGLSITGCLSTGRLAPMPEQSLAEEISDEETPQPRLARSQQPESGGVSLRRPSNLPPTSTPVPAGPAGTGVSQTSLSIKPAGAPMNARAWVNGKPIFEDEVLYVVGPEMRSFQNMPEPRRSEALYERLGQVLDQLIDQELMYQDGVSKLEKANPRALDKLKEYVGQEFDKQVAKMQKAGIPPEYLREIEPIARRALQRSLISMEYARSRIKPGLDSMVSLETIKEYYEDHKNEFQTVDKVKWQNVFIEVGPKHPTVAAARKYAEQLLASCRSPEDFARLIPYDDGDSVKRGGEGLGQRRGEIQPSILEEHLFRLREGEIGPVVEMPSGVHLIRVVKRDFAGQVPLNDETQKTIRRKLEGQLADREYRRIVRELRQRAIIRKETNPQ
jgi:parvulin-like peptidyl-prolyl isomerase